MKQYLTIAQGRKFLINVILALSSIWLLGPYLAIAGKVPLGNLANKITTSLAVFFIFYIIEYLKREKSAKETSSLPGDIEQELENIRQSIKSALRTLYRGVVKSFLFRYKKPWYLVLGPAQAGKSTLLNKSNLNIKGLDNLPPMTITPTTSFNWWLADEAVFIDVGGRYLKEDKEKSTNHEMLFQGFFKLLKKYRRYKPINGLILMINLQEMTVNIREQAQLNALRKIINQLILEFIQFPIYLIITRCDLIEGFKEFFEDLGPEERDQIFGIRFPLTVKPQSLPQLFNDEFNTLLERLNERIIWRIQKENSSEKICNIKNFPLQIECLKNPLAKLLNVILPSTEVNLRGIFFTSALQKDAPLDNLNKTLAHAFDIHHLHNYYRNTPSKNFFLSEIFKRVIYPEARFFSINDTDHRLQFVMSLLITLIATTCIYFFYSSYQYNLQTIQKGQQVIHLHHQEISHGRNHLIQQLNTLASLIRDLNHKKSPWYAKIGMHETQKLREQAEASYYQLLTTKFLPYLRQSLEIQLHNIPEDDANQIYAALKGYLMLGDHKHLEPSFLTAWFDNYWLQLGKGSAYQQNLHQHLTALLRGQLNEVLLNQQLIESKRAILNNIPQSRLVLTILQNQYQKSPVKLAHDPQNKLFVNLPIEVPGIYNIINFKQVYYNEIPNTCKEITHGNWVLGIKPQITFSVISLNQLANEVKAIYLNEYSLTWGNILAKIKIEQFQSLSQIIDMLEMLSNPQSSLISLINTIKNNTQPISDDVEFSHQVSSRFLSLNSLSTELLKNSQQNVLLAAKEYLTKIVSASDLDKGSYDAAKARMENQGINADAISLLLQQAHMLPEPLQTWHTTIAAESWRLILKNALNYLNRIWVASVYPQYQTILDKRYPLFKESTVDASLTDFANFFGNGGTMDTFFKNYLQPFVDNSKFYWELKNVEGQRINISQNTLEMFIRAALIQRMFFPEDSRIPAITFSLVPVDLDSNVQSFSLELDGQTVLFQKDNEQIISLYWPGPQPNHSAITFVDTQGKKAVLAETGPWSWFRILDKSHLESTSSPKHFKLTFYLNTNVVHYELYTNGIVNPFILGILDAFRCPDNLF
jgi:type VI secretion system protein ImpL